MYNIIKQRRGCITQIWLSWQVMTIHVVHKGEIHTNRKLYLLVTKRGLSSDIDTSQCVSFSVNNITVVVVVWPFRVNTVVRSWTPDLTKYGCSTINVWRRVTYRPVVPDACWPWFGLVFGRSTEPTGTQLLPFNTGEWIMTSMYVIEQTCTRLLQVNTM